MKMKRILILLLSMVLLTGCDQLQNVDAPESFSEAAIALPQLNTETPEEPTFQAPLVETNPGMLRWGREQLSSLQKETYDDLETAVACHQEAPVEVTAGSEDVRQVLEAISMDHPEFFWFDGQATYLTTTSLLGEKMEVSLTYSMTVEEAQSALGTVESYAAACLSSVADAQSDYDKILGVYRYIITETDYVLSETDQSFLSVMSRGEGTCAGYSRCFQYLMHRMNIPCTMATGYGEGGESHGWNVVECGGRWYHVDVTWGDPVLEDGSPGDALEYTYCMVTDQEILRTHGLDSAIPLPECTAVEHNYYRQSGLYMTAWDTVRYESLMRGAAERGESWFTVRCDGPEVYEAAMNALIGNSGVMTIMTNCGIEIPEDGVTYSYDDIFYEISVKIS